MSPAEGFEHMLVARAGEKVEATASVLAGEIQEAGAETWMDAQMLESILWWNRDGNFRVADVSGLAAQVEVRSPLFDYRMVEFAAALPHKYKVNRLFSPEGNKFLPRHCYRQMVPPRVGNAPKRGMAHGIRWPQAIASNPGWERAFSAAYTKLEGAGLDGGRARRAWRAYQEAVRTGGDRSPHSGPMMTAFMLAAWLDRQRARTPVAA